MTKAVLDEVQISSFSSGSIERHLFVHVLSNLDNDVGLGLVPAGRAKLPVGQPVAVQVVITDRRVRLVREIEATAEDVLKSKLSLWVRILVKIVASDIFHFLSHCWHGCLSAERSRVLPDFDLINKQLFFKCQVRANSWEKEEIIYELLKTFRKESGRNLSKFLQGQNCDVSGLACGLACGLA